MFAHGCFWHGCPEHGTQPSTNAAYWTQKIEANRRRDEPTTAALERDGWTVIRRALGARGSRSRGGGDSAAGSLAGLIEPVSAHTAAITEARPLADLVGGL